MSIKTPETKKKQKNSLKDRLDLYNYDKQMQSTWKLIEKNIPENIKLYKNYDNTLVNSAMSKTLRNNNLKALLSLGRIAKKYGIDWDTITRKDVNQIQTYIMETWADPEGKETWHTAGHKKFLMQFVRWLKTGKRNHSKKISEPEEIIDIEIRKVAQRITREDLLTDDEEQEILDACGDNLRNRAMIALQMEAGDRAGENLNCKLGHFTFLDNGGAVFSVDGKTEDRPIHLLKCVPDLAAWFAVHPKKNDKYAPTWITSTGGHLKYGAARKIIKNAVETAIKKKEKIKEGSSSLSNKRVFMTLMRKKEITQSHKWMSPQLSKKRHGWTPDSKILGTYENLIQEDVAEAVWQHYGIELKDEEKEKVMPKVCPICKKVNPAGGDRCNQCGKPLSIEAAIAAEEKENEKNQKLLDTLEELKHQQKSDKAELLEMFSEKLDEMRTSGYVPK